MESNYIYKSIGFCFQVDSGLINATIYENLVFFAKIKGIPEDLIEFEVSRVMVRLSLLPFKNSLVYKMSGGWKRKVSFAIALLGNPKIIIMDEPTSGMDKMTRKLFWDLIETLKQEKKTVIFTTQFLDEAEFLSDRIAVLSKGNLKRELTLLTSFKRETFCSGKCGLY